MKKFINRESEMSALQKQYETKGAALVVIYGRRRVGKTALISEFLRHHKESLYFLATEESESQNLSAFRILASEYTKNELLASSNADWMQVFKTVMAHKTKQKKIIVIDEFQYIGLSNKAFPSIMQKIWDTFLKDENVMLIICGSLISLMQSQTLDYSSPLYGRRTAQIKLKQIPFKYYREFFEKKDAVKLLPYYAVCGGVPKYISTFTKKGSIYDEISQTILNPQSYLYEEPYFLLQKEVTEIGSYFSLIKAIAAGNRRLSKIAAFMGVKQTTLTRYLKTLIDLDLIKRDVPVTERTPENSKSGWYSITDNFIAFWFKFVYPYRSYLERGETDYALLKIKEGFIQNHVSYVYEDICRERMWDFSTENMWDFSFDKVGRYWGPLTKETDIVALDTKGSHMVLGECKYTTEKKRAVCPSLIARESSAPFQKKPGLQT